MFNTFAEFSILRLSYASKYMYNDLLFYTYYYHIIFFVSVLHSHEPLYEPVDYHTEEVRINDPDQLKVQLKGLQPENPYRYGSHIHQDNIKAVLSVSDCKLTPLSHYLYIFIRISTIKEFLYQLAILLRTTTIDCKVGRAITVLEEIEKNQILLNIEKWFFLDIGCFNIIFVDCCLRIMVGQKQI